MVSQQQSYFFFSKEQPRIVQPVLARIKKITKFG